MEIMGPPTEREVELIRQVVASRLPATDAGEILPRARRGAYEEISILFLSVRMGRKSGEDPVVALLQTLVPRELWHYYNLLPHLASWLEEWVYGLTGPSPMDGFAPPGLARMFWLFPPFPKKLLERGYLYGLSLQPGIPPKHLQILREIPLLPPEELTRFKRERWRYYALYTKTPFRLVRGPRLIRGPSLA